MRSTQPSGGRDAIPMQSCGDIDEYALDNGLTVLVRQTTAIPVVAMYLTYRVGSRHERPGQTGISHMLEHMMFKGSRRFNESNGNSIFSTLQRTGAMVNATTSLDWTHYFNVVPSAHLALAMDIEADRMAHALIRPDDLESERKVVLAEYDFRLDDAMERLCQAVWSAAFTTHGYHHPTIGRRSDIESISREQLTDYYRRHYTPDNATLTLVGDVGADQAVSMADRYFSSIPRATDTTRESGPEEDVQSDLRRVSIEASDQQRWLMLGYKAPRGLSPDADALDLLGLILMSGPEARLFKPFFGTGLVVDHLTEMTRTHDPGLFFVLMLLGSAGDHAAAERMLRDEIEHIRTSGVGKHELERAKLIRLAQLAFSEDGAQSTCNALADGVAAGDWTLYPSMKQRIAEVSTVDVQRVAQTYLTDGRLTVGSYG